MPTSSARPSRRSPFELLTSFFSWLLSGETLTVVANAPVEARDVSALRWVFDSQAVPDAPEHGATGESSMVRWLFGVDEEPVVDAVEADAEIGVLGWLLTSQGPGASSSSDDEEIS